jgi:hypothetical protein
MSPGAGQDRFFPLLENSNHEFLTSNSRISICERLGWYGSMGKARKTAYLSGKEVQV